VRDTVAVIEIQLVKKVLYSSVRSRLARMPVSSRSTNYFNLRSLEHLQVHWSLTTVLLYEQRWYST